MLWTWERADEDDYAGFYIRRDGKTVADAISQEWAEFIVHALNRDEITFRRSENSNPSEPEIAF